MNKTDTATDKMLERTNYERAVVDAKKQGVFPPRKPGSKIVNQPRLTFDYDKVEPTPTTEPPLPTSDAAQKRVPNSYRNSNPTHDKIAAVRGKSTLAKEKQAKIDYAQPVDMYADSIPYFVRNCDSLRQD
jgi:hypothetical protein